MSDGRLRAADENSALFVREWDVPWHAQLIPLGLACLLWTFWLLFSVNGRMPNWALSWTEVWHGHQLPILLHMFAHGGLLHIVMNSAALVLLGGPLVSRLGAPPLSWARFFYIFIGSGLCGGATFLLLNFGKPAAMYGASGAIFGILGALARVHPTTGDAVPVTSPRSWMMAKFFIQNHIALVIVLVIIALVTGSSAHLSWEAHLGGLLFGFFAAPLFMRRHGNVTEA